jgi:3-phenylpropionate/trans-cinnamate dioxygenase ferredoxin reductase subunit
MSGGPIVIVGGGHAAAQLCGQLVDAGAGSRVHLVTDESVHPYHRPPLSKTFLKSGDEPHQLHRDAAWYQQHGIRVLLGQRATAIDPARCSVTLGSGQSIGYEWLVLATGTRPRMLPQLDGPLRNVAALRCASDCCRRRADRSRSSGADSSAWRSRPPRGTSAGP